MQKYKWGEIVNGEKHFPLHAGQSDILRSTARFRLASAGTGGGKTACGPLWMMDQIKQTPKGKWLVVAPTYSIMTRETAPTMVSTFANTDFEGRYVESRNRYYLPDGGMIWLISADRSTSLEGGQFDGAWIDEGGQIKFSSWVSIQGRLGMKRAPALITTTPYSLNWLYYEFYKRWQRGDPEYFVRQWSSIMNPRYSREEFTRVCGSMSAGRLGMRYMGQFVRFGGIVYPDFEAAVVDPFEPPPGRLIGGIDFGWGSPFAALAGTVFKQPDGTEVIYIWYERYKTQTLIEDHALALPKDVLWYCDPSRPDSIRQLKKAGCWARAGNNNIMHGIDAVNGRIYHRKILISRNCRALAAEASEYRFPEIDAEDEKYAEKPIDEFNHALDALRYMVMAVDGHRLSTRSKNKPDEVDNR